MNVQQPRNNPYYQSSPQRQSSYPNNNIGLGGYSQAQAQGVPSSNPYGMGSSNFRSTKQPNEVADSGDGDLYSQGRSTFIRKVYTLLAISLVVTTLICLWAMKS